MRKTDDTFWRTWSVTLLPWSLKCFASGLDNLARLIKRDKLTCGAATEQNHQIKKKQKKNRKLLTVIATIINIKSQAMLVFLILNIPRVFLLGLEIERIVKFRTCMVR